MPQLEAAACGVPVMAVDYSAMSDVVEKTGGIPIRVERMFADIGTGAWRALPDNTDFVNKLTNILEKPVEIRQRMGKTAKEGILKYFTWDRTAQILDNYFDSIELKGLQGKWDAPMRNCGQILPMPSNMKNAEFIDWIIINMLQETELLNTRIAMRYLNDLNYGFRKHGRDIINWNQQLLYNEICVYLKNKQECELVRTGKLALAPMDFIEYAHKRMEYVG